MGNFSFYVILMFVFLGIMYVIDNKVEQNTTESNFQVICLAGVEYWHKRSGNKELLAVKMTVDNTVSTCEH